MILAASLLLIQPQEINAAQLAGLTLKYYSDAKSLTGTIVLTSSVTNRSLQVETQLSYERPARVYLSQRKMGQDNARGLITSDGTLFSYDAPMQLKQTNNERLMEFVKKPDETATVGRIVQIGQQSLPDYGPPLWIVLAHLPNLKTLRSTWADIKVIDQNEELVRLGGNYREDALVEPTGTWTMDVTRAGELRRYSLTTTIAAPLTDTGKPVRHSDPITVTNVWAVNLKVNQPIDAKVFTVVR